MTRNYKLNLNIWGSMLAVSVVALAGSGLTAIQATQRLAANVAEGLESNKQIARYEREATEEIARLAEQTAVNRERVASIRDFTDEVTLRGYDCDPEFRPDFPHPQIWSRPDRPVDVVDNSGITIGFIASDGVFIFHPQCRG
jgi:hypothetical protein